MKAYFVVLLGLVSAAKINQVSVRNTPEVEKPNQYNRVCDVTVATNVGCAAQTGRVCDAVNRQSGCHDSLEHVHNNTPETTGTPTWGARAQTERICDAVNRQSGCHDSLEHVHNNTPETTGTPSW
jgi:hypothetical protein